MPHTERPRLSTGVPGLDNVLNGGLPGAHVYLVQGEAGTGKTTMALQFLLEGVKRGEPGLFVTLSQTEYELRMIAESHGWDISGIQIVELQTETTRQDDQTVFYPIDVRLDATRQAVIAAIEAHAPKRMVYDSLVEVRQLSRDDVLFQRELISLKSLLHEKGVATYFVDLPTDNGADPEVESLAHGIFSLDKSLPAYGQARRRIDIAKMRGVRYFDGYHDMDIIEEKGIVVFPRVVPELTPEQTGGDLIRSGIDDLDDMLGGGMEPGTTTLIIGQAGTGKSTLSSLYTYTALERGETVAMFLFEERPETFFRRSEGLGLPLRDYADKGALRLFDFNPSEISHGQFNQMALDAVEDLGVSVVLIDSFTGYVNGLANPQEAVVQIQLLLKYLARRNVLTLLVVAQNGLLGHNMNTTVDVSFLGDTVIFLRMYEWPATIRRTISVVKKRHGPHDLDVRQLRIETEGVSIQEFVAPPPGRPSPIND